MDVQTPSPHIAFNMCCIDAQSASLRTLPVRLIVLDGTFYCLYLFQTLASAAELERVVRYSEISILVLKSDVIAQLASD